MLSLTGAENLASTHSIQSTWLLQFCESLKGGWLKIYELKITRGLVILDSLCNRTQINNSGQFLGLVGMCRVMFCWILMETFGPGDSHILPRYTMLRRVICRVAPALGHSFTLKSLFMHNWSEIETGYHFTRLE